MELPRSIWNKVFLRIGSTSVMNSDFNMTLYAALYIATLILRIFNTNSTETYSLHSSYSKKTLNALISNFREFKEQLLRRWWKISQIVIDVYRELINL